MAIHDKEETARQFHAVADLAALIPGMEYALQLIGQELDGLRKRLAAALERTFEPVAPATRRGRPPRKKAQLKPVPVAAPAALRRGWPADPAERKREMKRRRAKWQRKQNGLKIPAGRSTRVQAVRGVA